MADIIAFKGAGLPAGDLAMYKRNLEQAQETAPTIGGLPFLKMGKDAVWRYGQTDTEVQEGSEWAVNPVTFKKGFIAWAESGGTKPLGEVMKPVLAGNLPRLEQMADVGAEWKDNVYFELTCLNGDDEGKTVKFANSTKGAVEAFHVLIAHLIHQIDVDKSKLVPIVALQSTGYQHSNRSYGIKGWVAKPHFEIIEWVSNGQAPAEAQEDEPDEEVKQPEQPQRRAAVPSRGSAAAKREKADFREPAATSRGSAPTLGSEIPRNAPKRAAAAAGPDSEEGGNGQVGSNPGGSAEDAANAYTGDPAGPVVRRRRRAAVTDVA